ncbi:tetratricopeptide repeat-containing sulfotransferase family protein [Rheinheimera pacifica]|uniref:tetratricopeptide repeat-containing sulfotransferase family protein n=1 Tax=Rheinheimera pacifica TaxID=173990 RepID=UPI002EDA8B99
MNTQQLSLPPQSDSSQAGMQEVIILKRRGEHEQARNKANQLLAHFPQCIASLHLNYQLAIADSNFIEAEGYLREALKILPEHPVLLLNQAQLSLSRYQYAAAVKLADKAAAVYVGNNTVFLAAISKVVMQAEQPAIAISVYQRMLAVEPDNTHFKHQLALCYFFTNQPQKAYILLNEVIAKSPNNAGAIHLRSALQTYTNDHNHIEDLRKFVADVASQHPAIYYALAKELEDIADYKESFAMLKQGAALMRKQLCYNEAAELKSIADIIKSTTDIVVDSLVQESSGPIFIVGMPRTGTTLVERVLTQHEDVHSVGELSLFPQLLASMAQQYMAQHKSVGSLHEAALKIDFAELGRRYTIAVAEISAGKPYTLDKLPINFLYCGFIKKALPNARIIHLCRNPMDSCYAIFKTLFINAYSFSYDLDELANYYITYKNIMAHWHSVMPGAILDVHYEEMVNDAAKTTQRLVQWCGLTYKSELLEFHKADSVSTTASAAQVRKPIYKSSVEKWRNVETELTALQFKLKQAGVVF